MWKIFVVIGIIIKKKGGRKKKNIGKYKEIILFIFSRGVHYITCNSMIGIDFKVFSTVKILMGKRF